MSADGTVDRIIAALIELQQLQIQAHTLAGVMWEWKRPSARHDGCACGRCLRTNVAPPQPDSVAQRISPVTLGARAGAAQDALR
jgi:hypothetical protein